MATTLSKLTDTIIALATPPGVGAIGVIRLSGKQAFEWANELFFGKDLLRQKSHTVHLGTLRYEGAILDEALVTIFKGPHSYTGEDVIEISCHGSDFIIRKVMETLVRMGARPADKGEFTMRAFLNGKMDLSQAEAVADLISSNSESSHELAMQQMRGGFSEEIKNLRAQLIDFASLIELELDFSEEDVEFANRTALTDLVEKIQGIVKALIDSFLLGNVLKNGVNTVIVGRPNAGKSTLLNALLQEDRAIVSDIEGTTRDTIEEILNIQGVNFRLIDTAGIREANDTIEAIGVKKTFEKVRQSALVVYVFDAQKTAVEEVHKDIDQLLHPNIILLVVANKMDINPYAKAADYLNEHLSEAQFIPLSAKNKMNLALLEEKLYQSVISGEISTGDTILSNTRHYAALQQTQESLHAVLQGLSSDVPSDLIAMDIRRALHFLGEITGEISTDDLLENIFGNFCIGK